MVLLGGAANEGLVVVVGRIVQRSALRVQVLNLEAVTERVFSHHETDDGMVDGGGSLALHAAGSVDAPFLRVRGEVGTGGRSGSNHVGVGLIAALLLAIYGLRRE